MVPHDNVAEGEIIISSPAKSAFCYYNNPEMTEQKFYKGFLYTGDVGTWDENEFVTVRGRKDDMIVSAGENIYPPQIEAVLNDHPRSQRAPLSVRRTSCAAKLLRHMLCRAIPPSPLRS